MAATWWSRLIREQDGQRGGMLLAWNPHVSTAYLINPATRTRTTLQLHGVPRLRSTAPPQVTDVGLAW